MQSFSKLMSLFALTDKTWPGWPLKLDAVQCGEVQSQSILIVKF